MSQAIEGCLRFLKEKKPILGIGVFFIFLFSSLFFGFVNYSNAGSNYDGYSANNGQWMPDSISDSAIDSAVGGVKVTAPGTDKAIEKTKGEVAEGNEGDMFNWKKMFAWEKWLDAAKMAAGNAYKSAVKSFLNQLAYDTATYIATGDKGQSPMFETRKPADLLRNTMDKAAGDFLEQFANNAFNIGLCEPGSGIKLKITLGLRRDIGRYQPKCTFSQMQSNWQRAMNDPNFLGNFQNMINPWDNDMGVALSVGIANIDYKMRLKEAKILEYLADKGIKPVTEPISGRVSTPGTLVASYMKQPVEKANESYFVYTGNVAADAIGIFIDTLIGKLIEEWFKKGIVTNFDADYNSNFSDLTNFYGGAVMDGLQKAKDRFRKFIMPNFGVRGDYNILSELTMCPDPNKAGPTNCVITENFRQAIEKRLTVIEAIEKNYLNKGAAFGFLSDGLEPKYNEGYPYRSMIILRKFRILPVGWELGAQYIASSTANIRTTVTLGDMVNCYKENDGYDEGVFANQNWCRGLVDPNWVLKAPLNYCKKEGYGPEIESEFVSGEGLNSSLSVSRKDNYCADEQTCIDENPDGSCNYYGYCTEDKRGWLFGSNTSCEARFNTCETFKDDASKSESVSYLQNTLDNRDCTMDNVGCRAYKQASTTIDAYRDGKVEWATSSLDSYIYLDSDAVSCSAAADGCQQLIRIVPGVNIYQDGSFEASSTIIEEDGMFHGRKAMTLTGAGPYIHELPIFRNIGSSDVFIGDSYTLSLYARDCGVMTVMIRANNGNTWNDLNDMATSSGNTDGNWTLLTATARLSGGNSIRIEMDGFSGPSCRIDAIKVEKGGARTEYSDYGGGALAYQKLIPDYLAQVCYSNYNTSVFSGIYNLAPGAPDVCKKYARRCSPQEDGCELYTSLTKAISVPARISETDKCPSECVGYDYYIQSRSTFDSSRGESFIPRTAKSCSSEAAGCDQFTNLDKIGPESRSGGAKGAEAIEYYSDLRQCALSGTAGCSEYYTWEGSSDSGYQLRVHNLMADEIVAGVFDYDNPGVVSNEPYNGLLCASTTYNLLNNSMCREFYSRNGVVSYRFLNYTRTCTSDCHPYRKTENNIDPDIITPASCTGPSMHWDDAGTPADPIDDYCISCISGGLWNSEHDACIYMAAPNEGRKCSAVQNGCREYTGNMGANMRDVLKSDFEGNASGWFGYGSTNVGVDNESLKVGGNSLLATGSGPVMIARNVAGQVKAGKSYSLSFVAKSASTTSNSFIRIYLTNGVSSSTFSTSTAMILNLFSDWRMYELNLESLHNDPNENEELILVADDNFYVDSILLTEITDRYYLIKDSWNTPDACFGQDGCDAYRDSTNKNHYLKSFSDLCSDTAVGCQMFIDTENSSDHLQTINNSTGVDVVTPADSAVFVVYDEKKKCLSEEKGCQRMGLEVDYASSSIYRDVYMINDPDKYPVILCPEGAEYCKKWTSAEGASIFKDPMDQVCEWRQMDNMGVSGFGWYRKKINKCDVNNDGSITSGIENDYCLNDSDCQVGPCILDMNDYPCSVTVGGGTAKTLGNTGAEIKQPSADSEGYNWTGFCPQNQASCSEYIDPLSIYSSNLLYNGNFTQDIDSNGIADGWATTAMSAGQQSVGGSRNTLYSFAVDGDGASPFVVSLMATTGVYFYVINPADNSLVGTSSLTLISYGERISRNVYIGIDNVNLTVNAGNVTLMPSGRTVEYKESPVGYVLSRKIDRKSCNGEVDNKAGCILFNERRYGSELVWDSDLSYDTATSVPSLAGIPSERDSNSLLKVSPDRDCNKWLSCRSYAKNEKGENVCYEIGLCSSLSDSGSCNNYEAVKRVDQVYPLNISDISNVTGYSKVSYGNNPYGESLYPLDRMREIGSNTQVPNGNFEIYGSNKYPISWIIQNGGANVSANSSYAAIINNPYEMQKENIAKAPDGRSILKLGSTYQAVSGEIDTVNGTTYILSVYINTRKLSSGSAVAIIEGVPSARVSAVSGLDWVQRRVSFVANSNVTKVRLFAESATGEPVGNFFFDDVSIKNVLRTGDGDMSLQSCRLYPESDSLSCSYNDGSGIWRKGWYGYCLEYDRYPGSDDNCLMWWPVDNIQGDGVNENIGYDGKYPLYYCQAATTNRPIERRRIHNRGEIVYGRCNGGCAEHINAVSCPEGYTAVMDWMDPGRCPKKKKGFFHTITFGLIDDRQYVPGQSSQCRFACVANGPQYSVEGAYAWYDYRAGILPETVVNPSSDNIVIPAEVGLRYFDPYDGVVTDYLAYCKNMVQVVTPSGQNKYWSGRVYDDSNYTVPGLGYVLNTYGNPFGSMNPPYPANNPYEWGGQAARPVPAIGVRRDQANAGAPYSIDISAYPYATVGMCATSRDLCLIGVDATASNRYNCSANDSCIAFPPTSTGSARAEISRLFAKSYENWSWDEASNVYRRSPTFTNTAYHCSGNNAVSCVGNFECGANDCVSTTTTGTVCAGGARAGLGCQTTCGGGSTCSTNSGDYSYYLCFGGTITASSSCAGGAGQCRMAMDGSSRCISAATNAAGSTCGDMQVNSLGVEALAYDCVSGPGLPAGNCASCELVGTTTEEHTYCASSTNPLIGAQTCCPGGTCSVTSSFVCDGTANPCTQCQGIGQCVAFSSSVTAGTWDVPPLCGGTPPTRPAYPGDNCSVPPIVRNVRAYGAGPGSTVDIDGFDFVNLTFNTDVDDNQLPLVMYSINWGDGSSAVASGIEMLDRPSAQNPHSVYHVYDYWNVRDNMSGRPPCVEPPQPSTTNCCGADYCLVTPHITVRDNWGWYNNGTIPNVASSTNPGPRIRVNMQ